MSFRHVDDFDEYWDSHKRHFPGVTKTQAREIFNSGFIHGIKFSTDLIDSSNPDNQRVDVRILPLHDIKSFDEATKHVTAAAANPAMRPVRPAGANNG